MAPKSKKSKKMPPWSAKDDESGIMSASDMTPAQIKKARAMMAAKKKKAKK
jgi:hypothetical protein